MQHTCQLITQSRTESIKPIVNLPLIDTFSLENFQHMVPSYSYSYIEYPAHVLKMLKLQINLFFVKNVHFSRTKLGCGGMKLILPGLAKREI